MQRQLRLVSATLLISALLGCGGSSVDVDDGDVDDFAVNAAFDEVGHTFHKEFRSNDVLSIRVSFSHFSFTAVDEDWTILISLQSVEAEPLDLQRSYTMGADETSRVVASGSLVHKVYRDDGELVTSVFNAQEGTGGILLTSFDSVGAQGYFTFSGIGPATMNVVGGFDVTF